MRVKEMSALQIFEVRLVMVTLRLGLHYDLH